MYFRQLLVSAIVGIVSLTAFEPLGLWPFSFIAIIILVANIYQSNPKQSFFHGWAFGIGLFGVGVSWVYVSLSTYGGMPWWMGVPVVTVFCLFLALFVAIPCFIASFFTPLGSTARLVLFPFVWIIFEWCKSWFLTGFPWLEIGYSQTNSWLFGLAPLGGVYLVGFVTIALSCLMLSFHFKKMNKALSILILLPLFIIIWNVNNLEWSRNNGQELTVGIVQPNVPIQNKWQAENRDKIISNLVGASRLLSVRQTVDLIVWPETALPLYIQQTDSQFWNSINPQDTALLTGIMDVENLSTDESQFYNAAMLHCADSQQIYRKHHLVPFGEYLPLRAIFSWVLDYLNLPMSDISSWNENKPLSCQLSNGKELSIGLSICYEDAFSNELREAIGDATLMVNISEDAWFGDSLAPHQRLQMAQMRARELSRPLVRSANSGPSAIINERGEIVAISPQFQESTLVERVNPQVGDTPFKRYGNWICYLSILVLVVFCISRRNKLIKVETK